jgi:Na+-transporting NADH:ubiquinone oxidoreductase subunit C
VSEQPLNIATNKKQTILFMVILSFVCALILSLLASLLAAPKTIAKDLDRSKQMMIAAKILSHEGYFLITDNEGKTIPAKYTPEGLLIAGSIHDIATKEQLLKIYRRRLAPMLVNKDGDLVSFKTAGLNEEEYTNTYRKTGYYKQPYKLIYELLPNAQEILQPEKTSSLKPEGYVIPINGFGLWDAIYGYIALKPDGNTVIGISWYDQKETPGLGANIAEAQWQNLFPGKKIFLENQDGSIDYKTTPVGITVVKGKVPEVLGNSPKAKSAVDGMSGATLTGNGVTDAYREVLDAYRPFFIKLNKATSGKNRS